MPSFAEYTYLLGRVGSWTINDLGDMLVEIERDVELSAGERKELLEALYRLLWQRAQVEMKGSGGPGPAPGGAGPAPGRA